MKGSSDWWMRWRGPIRAALLPARAGWALANRVGWLPEPPVGSEPHLHPLALDHWRASIEDATVYLEYGAGGSTVEAVQTVPHVVSVETDRRYLATVERRVAANPKAGAWHPIWIDIGWTSQWGQPIIDWPTPERVKCWRRYPSAPWGRLEALGLVPDFVFIDGRFRAASVLESFVQLPDGVDCRFLLDDFEDRAAAYGDVLKFAEDVEALGDAVAFRRKSTFDRAACLQHLERAYADPL